MRNVHRVNDARQHAPEGCSGLRQHGARTLLHCRLSKILEGLESSVVNETRAAQNVTRPGPRGSAHVLGEGAHAQVRLKASTRPTAAQGSVRIGTHMPNFAGPGARPTHRAVIDDDTRANAHLTRHVHEGRRPTGHTRTRVSDRVGRQVRFIRDDHRVQVTKWGK